MVGRVRSEPWRLGEAARPDAGGRYLGLEGVDRRVYLGENRARRGHAGVFRADDASVS